MGRDALILIAGRFAQALLTVAALRVMTSLLSPSQVGSVYLMLSFASWFSLFLISPVGNYINRKLYGWHKLGRMPARFRLYDLYVLGVVALVLPVVYVSKTMFGLGSELPLWHFIAVVALYVYAVTWNQTVIPALNLLGRRGAFVGFSVLSAGLGLTLSWAFSLFSGPTAYAWLYGQAAGLLVTYFLSRLKLRTQTPDSDAQGGLAVLTEDNLRGVWAFTAPLAVSSLFMWFQTQSYRLIVERFAGPEFLGYLVVGLGISASLASVTESLVQQLYFPEFYRKLHGATDAERRLALSQLAARALPVYIVLAAFTCVMAPHLTRALAAAKFQQAWKFVALGAIVEMFRMTTNIFSITAHAEMKTSSLIKPFAAGGGATALIVLAVCLTGRQGLLVPAGMAAGGLISLLLMRASMGKVSDFRMDKSQLFKAAVLSLGFVPGLLMLHRTSVLQSAAVLAVFGLYFLFAQWRLMATQRQESYPADPGGEAEMREDTIKAEI